MRRMAGLLALVVLGACSGGDGDAGAAPATPTTALNPTTPAPAPTALPPTTTTAVPLPPTTAILAGQPRALADQVVAAEQALRDPATPPEAFRDHALVQQRTYRALVVRPEWMDAVRARVPADLRPALEANVTAGVALRALVKSPKTELPDWRIVTPAPADELLGYYREAEATFGVHWSYLAAIHLVETRMGRIRGVSEAGAQGPMQFMPATWAAYGEGDINSNRDSILAAARYLKRNGAPGDMANALWNYNHSDKYVRAVSLYAERMRTESRAYYAYWHWQVYYLMVSGDVLLPEGWQKTA